MTDLSGVTGELEAIEALLRERPHSRFSGEWGRMSGLISPDEAQAVHIVSRENYAGAAVLFGRWLVDVEGDDERGRSHLTFISLRSIDRVRLLSPNEVTMLGISAPLVQVSDLVLTVFTGGSPSGQYWVAAGDRESKSLLNFTGKLLSTSG